MIKRIVINDKPCGCGIVLVVAAIHVETVPEVGRDTTYTIHRVNEHTCLAHLEEEGK